MKDKPEMPKGFTCQCGKFHEFGVYVAAHWRERLTHTCDKCGQKHHVQHGRVKATGKPGKRFCIVHPAEPATYEKNVPCAPGGILHVCAQCAKPESGRAVFEAYQKGNQHRIDRQIASEKKLN